jgi:hypothetical protein
MAKTLKQKIAERKKEMEDKEINYKTTLIATMLGRRIGRYNRDNGCDETWDVFKNERFEIEDYGVNCIDGGGFHREVKYNGKRVFYMAGGGEELFIPGKWEREFNKLYAQTQRKERQNKREERAKQKLAKKTQEREERKRWGL